MSRRLPLYGLALALLGCLVMSVPGIAADIYNPKPDKEDFILPMPGGAKMAFRPVHLGKTISGLGTKEITIGRGENPAFYEIPAKMEVTGAFNLGGPGSGREEWVYYLGKYEVTEAQYYSLMPPPKGALGKKVKKSRRPVDNISWFDAMEFIKRYNMWLWANAKGSLPKSKGWQGDSPAYVRLPTEEEWEFAARGGGLVEPSRYFRDNPYGFNLPKHEWFLPGFSSHKPKLKDVGLRKPNILGLYDMLGNTSEMTMSLYRIEYTHGRVGGFIVRGGNALITGKKAMRSSLRSEVEFFSQGKPKSQRGLGLRLMIASVAITTTQEFNRLAHVYENYTSPRRAGAAPPPSAAAPPGAGPAPSPASPMPASSALKTLAQARKRLEAASPGAYEAVKAQFNQLEGEMRKEILIRRKKEEGAAFSNIRVLVFALTDVYEKMQQIKSLTALFQRTKNQGIKARTRAKIEDRQRVKRAVLENLYADMLRQLDESAPPQVVERQFDAMGLWLADRHDPPLRLKVNSLVKKHYLAFRRTRQADPEGWLRDLNNL